MVTTKHRVVDRIRVMGSMKEILEEVEEEAEMEEELLLTLAQSSR
jgi:hypothetical protein